MELTKGQIHQLQFLEALKRVPIHKALTIRDLKDLDDAELASVIELRSPVKSEAKVAKLRKGRKHRVSLEERFWSKIVKTEECWNWTSAMYPTGYGSFYMDGQARRAHRVSYMLTYGIIPDGMVIDHLCHNPACVRPDHLRATTPKRNAENRAGANKNNVSGIRGVTWDKRAGKWIVQVGHKGKVHRGGFFNDKELANVTAKELREKLYGEEDGEAA